MISLRVAPSGCAGTAVLARAATVSSTRVDAQRRLLASSPDPSRPLTYVMAATQLVDRDLVDGGTP